MGAVIERTMRKYYDSNVGSLIVGYFLTTLDLTFDFKGNSQFYKLYSSKVVFGIGKGNINKNNDAYQTMRYVVCRGW